MEYELLLPVKSNLYEYSWSLALSVLAIHDGVTVLLGVSTYEYNDPRGICYIIIQYKL